MGRCQIGVFVLATPPRRHTQALSNPSRDSREEAQGQRELERWERWTVGSAGAPIIEWDEEAHTAWCVVWAPPCPDGNPQRLRRALAYRERNIGELELRVPLSPGENGDDNRQRRGHAGRPGDQREAEEELIDGAMFAIVEAAMSKFESTPRAKRSGSRRAGVTPAGPSDAAGLEPADLGHHALLSQRRADTT